MELTVRRVSQCKLKFSIVCRAPLEGSLLITLLKVGISRRVTSIASDLIVHLFVPDMAFYPDNHCLHLKHILAQ